MSRAAYLDLDGTLLGPGGSLLRDGSGAFTTDGVEALRLLADAGVAVVLTSGRSRPRLEAVRSVVGADGILPEMGALDSGYPVRPGQTVHEAIAETGITAALLAREPGLRVYAPAQWGREGSHALAGTLSADAHRFVAEYSGGTLRLADNGRAEGGGKLIHLLPAAASKAAAVARDVGARGLEPAACLAVGDSLQDLGMGDSVGRIAIVANGAAADATLAARAPWVTAGSFGAGVLEALRAWLAEVPPAA